MSATTPVYVLSGFLGSGKTTLLSHILKKKQNNKLLILQFEEGEEELELPDFQDLRWKQMTWSKKDLDQDFNSIKEEITAEIELGSYEEIWVEWNGMELFSRLEEIILQRQLGLFLHIEKVIYLADVPEANLLLGQTGEGPISQVAACDVAFLREAKNPVTRKQFIQKLKAVSPYLEISHYSGQNIRRELEKGKGSPVLEWTFYAITIGIWISIVPLISQHGVPLLKAFTIFMGVFLQAIPFLILGVLLSSAIQIYVSEKWISGIFPKKTVTAMLCGIFAGFFLPVCDCASIPVFKSLVKKGVPLPAAICFMTASPVINPVVILSTYYAYNGSIKAVLCRCVTGMVCSFLIGLSFVVKKPENYFKVDTEMGSFCTCGCYVSGNTSGGRGKKFWQFCIHARTEFYTVAKYLLAGIGISTIFQMLNLTKMGTLGSKWMPVSVLVMMLLAFLLSLCSSSDAVIARSITGTTNFIPTLGFLVFGPMMDIKNVIMLHSYFKKKFIVRLTVTTIVICFAVVVLLGIMVGGDFAL